MCLRHRRCGRYESMGNTIVQLRDPFSSGSMVVPSGLNCAARERDSEHWISNEHCIERRHQ
jgi:hypothetical protein